MLDVQPEPPALPSPLQLVEPTQEQAAAEAHLKVGLAYVLTLARARAVMADDEAARSAARLDPQCQLAAEIVVDEVRQRALKDSTSFQFYLALLAERVGPLPGVAA